MERWVRGWVAQIGCFFDLSGLPTGPFYWKISLHVGCFFFSFFFQNKMLIIIFRFLWFTRPIGLCTCALSLGPKSTDWFKNGSLQEANSYIGCKFASFSGLLGWWSKLPVGHPYSLLNSDLTPPPPACDELAFILLIFISCFCLHFIFFFLCILIYPFSFLLIYFVCFPPSPKPVPLSIQSGHFVQTICSLIFCFMCYYFSFLKLLGKRQT